MQYQKNNRPVRERYKGRDDGEALVELNIWGYFLVVGLMCAAGLYNSLRPKQPENSGVAPAGVELRVENPQEKDLTKTLIEAK